MTGLGLYFVLTESFVSGEVTVSFYRKAASSAEGLEFGEPDATDNRKSGAVIHKAEGQIMVVGMKFGEDEGCRCVWCKKLYYGTCFQAVSVIDIALFIMFCGFAPVFEQLLAVMFFKQPHV